MHHVQVDKGSHSACACKVKYFQVLLSSHTFTGTNSMYIYIYGILYVYV